MKSKKRRTLPGILKLPDPDTFRRRKQRDPKCSDCRGVLVISRGHAYCERCSLTTPLPIARVVSTGPNNGKYVYLKESIMKELREDYELVDDQLVALGRELKDRNIIIVEEIER